MSKGARAEKLPYRRTAAIPRPSRSRAQGIKLLRPAAWIPAVLITAVAIVVYANGFSIPFLFDDNTQIVRNSALGDYHQILRNPALAVRGVLMLTFALNYQWGGLDVFGYHLFNLLVHIANGILVYLLVVRTLQLPFFRGRYERDGTALALVTSLVFVAHPLQAMSVSYIVQRAESLAACFYLLGMLLFVVGATADTGRRRVAGYGGAFAAALLGVLTKQTVATLPVMILLYRLCFLRGESSGRSARYQWAALILIFSCLGVAVYMSRGYLFPVNPHRAGLRAGWFIPTAGLGVEGVTPWHYLLTQFGVVVWYLRLYLLPTRLTFDYGWPLVASFWQTDVLLPLAVLAVMAATAIACIRRYRLATFCLAWFFVVLAPSSSIIPLRDAAFEYRMYLPLVGLTWLLVVGAYDAAPRLAQWTGATPGGVRGMLALVAVAWITFLGVGTSIRNRVMQDPLRLAADSARKAPHNWRAQYDLGYRLAQEGRNDEAIEALEESTRCDPSKGMPRIELARLLVTQGRLEDAEKHLRAALGASERSVVAAANLNMAVLRQLQGEWREAIDFLGSAVALMPRWRNARQLRAQICEQHGRWRCAAEQYEALAHLDEGSAAEHDKRAAVNHFRAGVESLQLGNAPAAASEFAAAAKHDPGHAATYSYLAEAYGLLGDWEQAAEVITAAAGLAPNDPLIREDAERVRHRLSPGLPAAGRRS